jgi:hypothetical protein
MSNEDIKKTAERVMQQFVADFARQCNPAAYPHGQSAYQDYVHYRHDQALDYIHGAAILMITLGYARAGDYNTYIEQVESLKIRYLAEFKPKPEQTA